MYRFLIGFILVTTFDAAAGPAGAQQNFDGRWNIKAVLENGSCKKSHQYAVVIESGALRKGLLRRMSVSITGGLGADGRIRGSVQGNRTRVDVTGSLAGRSGSGDWVTAGRVTCSGRWSAEKSD